MPDRVSRAVSALACVSFAYGFLYRRFLPLVKHLTVPIGVAGIVLLWAGVGFLIAPVVARTTGSVLRKALHNGRADIARNVALTVLLLLPVLVIEIAGEYLLRKGQGPSRLTTDLPIS